MAPLARSSATACSSTSPTSTARWRRSRACCGPAASWRSRCRASATAILLLGSTLLRRLAGPRAGRLYGDAFNRISRHHHVDPPEVWRARLARVGLEMVEHQYYFSPAAHRAFDLSHYLGVPNLLARKLTGRWVLHPAQMALFWVWLRRYYEEPLPGARRVPVRPVPAEPRDRPSFATRVASQWLTRRMPAMATAPSGESTGADASPSLDLVWRAGGFRSSSSWHFVLAWTLFITRPYLNMDPDVVPMGREYLGVIQTHDFWLGVQTCGVCALWDGAVQAESPR